MLSVDAARAKRHVIRHGTSHMSDHLMVPIDSIKQDRHTIIDVPTYFTSRGPYCLNYNKGDLAVCDACCLEKLEVRMVKRSSKLDQDAC